MTEAAKVRTTVIIFINDQRYEAPGEEMRGADIKALGGVPPQNRLFREVPGPGEDVPISDEETVELKNGDKFYDLPRGVHGAPTLQDILTPDITRLREEFGSVEVVATPDGGLHIVLGSVRLPGGWSKSQTQMLIVVPPGYPEQRPSGFFAENVLTLAQGQQPRGTGINEIAGRPWLYFCWQPEAWNSQRDNLWKYVKLMTERFREVA
jgi:hypothetical protein